MRYSIEEIDAMRRVMFRVLTTRAIAARRTPPDDDAVFAALKDHTAAGKGLAELEAEWLALTRQP